MTRPKAVPAPSYDPQLALLVKAAPAGDDWLHEIKLDGFRMGCLVDRGTATLISRRAKEWTGEFPTVVAGAARLPARTALLDGEVAALLPDGRTSLRAMGTGTIVYFVFDLLFLDGEDLRPLPIEERKRRLRALLGAKPPEPLRYVDDQKGNGPAFFAEACREGLEGIVSKAARSPYRSGARNATWQKVKCVLRQELVIGGYERSVLGGLGALWLGYYERAGARAHGGLVFAGKVGTGFQRQEKELLAKLKKIERATAPFGVGLPTGYKVRDAVWVEPKLVCEVAFMEWTDHAHIRHGSFQALRPDKRATDVVREVPR